MVGDVMGKGIQAAAGMGQLRIALRAYAIEGHGPAEVLQRLDQLLEGLEEELATAVYLALDPATGALVYARAGHPPPMIVSPDGTTELLREGLAPPLGCMIDVQCVEDRTTIAPGAVLVVYTDGLIERRGTNIEHGLSRLRAVAATADLGDLDGFCTTLLDGMDADDRGDDIALLAVRFDGIG
jgi:serine phosphatase RsbU (regulator of sigma subunit)